MTDAAEGPRIYNLFPLLAGPVEAWTTHLDRIAAMDFNWIYVNPFHTPGFSGSLYAVKDYYKLNPQFQGSSKKSADALIRDFATEAEKRGIGVMMDLVVNHTGRDSLLTEQHPEWFAHEADGSLRAPGAIDPSDARNRVIWADLAELDYGDRPERQQIIDYFRKLVRHYVKLGVRGFRCDAAYKVPSHAWREIIDAGRKANGSVAFIAENLGARLEEVDQMADAGFDGLFNSSKWWDFEQNWPFEQYERFRHIAPSVSFPETHDTSRFAADLRGQGVSDANQMAQRARFAYMFSTVFSSGVMIPVGFEFGFSRELHVVNSRPTDWETPTFDISEFIGDANRMRKAIPALNEEGPERLVLLGDRRFVCLLRRAKSGGAWVLTMINSNHFGATTARLEWLDGDMIEGREVTPGREGETFRVGEEVTLMPSEIRVFVNG